MTSAGCTARGRFIMTLARSADSRKAFTDPMSSLKTTSLTLLNAVTASVTSIPAETVGFGRFSVTAVITGATALTGTVTFRGGDIIVSPLVGNGLITVAGTDLIATSSGITVATNQLTFTAVGAGTFTATIDFLRFPQFVIADYALTGGTGTLTLLSSGWSQ